MGKGGNIEDNAHPRRWATEGSSAFGREVHITKDEFPTRIHEVSKTLFYLGWAELNSAEDEEVWKIRRIQQISTVWEQKYAYDGYGAEHEGRGNEFFRFKWSERYLLNYS